MDSITLYSVEDYADFSVCFEERSMEDRLSFLIISADNRTLISEGCETR
jgi:hypothetical protein